VGAGRGAQPYLDGSDALGCQPVILATSEWPFGQLKWVKPPLAHSPQKCNLQTLQNQIISFRWPQKLHAGVATISLPSFRFFDDGSGVRCLKKSCTAEDPTGLQSKGRLFDHH
jgi:hypothetical protein